MKCSKSLYVITEAHDALMNFWILKEISGILISLPGIKRTILCICCICFVISIFLKYFSHIFHGNALNVFYTWINTYIRLYLSHVRKIVQDKMADRKTFVKKAQTFLWFSVKVIKIPNIFFKIKASCFNNHTQRFTTP